MPVTPQDGGTPTTGTPAPPEKTTPDENSLMLTAIAVRDWYMLAALLRPVVKDDAEEEDEDAPLLPTRRWKRTQLRRAFWSFVDMFPSLIQSQNNQLQVRAYL